MIPADLLAKMQSKDYRAALVGRHISHSLALQIQAIRKQRGWTRAEFARRLKMKTAEAIAFEVPGHDFNLETLMVMARVFDCALMVRFISFGEMAQSILRIGYDSCEVLPWDGER